MDNKTHKSNPVADSILNFGQINLGKGKAATSNLLEIIVSKKLDICFVQEPTVNKSKIVGFSKNNLVISKNCEVPKVAFIVNNREISTLFLENISNEFVIALELTFMSFSLILVNLYLPPAGSSVDENVAYNRRNDVVCALDHTKPILIAGDFNAKSYVWGSPTDDTRGTKILEFFENKNFTVLNSNSDPTFVGHRGSNFIDLTAANFEGLKLIKNWYLVDEETLSDHKLIFYQISFKKRDDEVLDRRFCNKKANWDKFLENVGT